MSFVNQIMAEAGGRNELIPASPDVLDDVEFPAFYSESEEDNQTGPDFRQVQIRYSRNFVFILLFLLIIFQVFNRLPVQSTSDLDFSHVAPISIAFAEESDVDTNKIEDDQNMPFRRMIVNPNHDQEGFELVEVKPDHFKPEASTPIHETLLQQAIVATEGPEQIESKEVVSKPVAPVKFDIKPSQYNQAADQIKTDNLLPTTRDMIQNGQVSEAIILLSDHLKLQPSSSEARLLLSSAWVKVGDREKAKEVLREGFDSVPNRAVFAQALAHLLVYEGRVELALRLLLGAAPEVAFDPEYHSFIAALQQQQGLHKDSINTYLSVLRVKPDSGKWWLGLGISMFAEMRYDEAEQAFRNVLDAPEVAPALKQFASQRLSELHKKEVAKAG